MLSEDTVRIRLKSRDPRNPPTIVVHSCEARWTLYSCMAANNSTASVVDRRNDSPLDTANTNQHIETEPQLSTFISHIWRVWASRLCSPGPVHKCISVHSEAELKTTHFIVWLSARKDWVRRNKLKRPVNMFKFNLYKIHQQFWLTGV